jgi:hypothetical protein
MPQYLCLVMHRTYVDVRLERKRIVLNEYHNVLHPNTIKKETKNTQKNDRDR